MLWLYVDFPQLQLDSVDNKPCEEQIPMIVVNGQHNAVVQANQAAIDCGVRLGFGLGRAISLSQQMQVINYDEKLTNKLLAQITQSAYQVIADISPMPPDGLLLRLSPMFVLYDDLAGCWQRVQEWLNSLQVSYRGATAFNPQAA
ncbi:MAG: DNA polymerase Y family protein, partial [Psychrobium sp.]